MFHRVFADHTNPKSVAYRLRQKRYRLLMDMVDQLPGTVSILDVGGTQDYWKMMAGDAVLPDKVRITLLNLQRQDITLDHLVSIAGDARSMPQFGDRQFDIVHSNSTIEHVGDYSDQTSMAQEVMRVGKQYYIQTPNRYFPIEPHFVFPFFQFLPLRVRAWLVQNFKLGWYPRIRDFHEALAEVKGIRLMTKSEIRSLFPDAAIFEEKYLGLTKSFVAYTPPGRA